MINLLPGFSISVNTEDSLGRIQNIINANSATNVKLIDDGKLGVLGIFFFLNNIMLTSILMLFTL